MQLLESSPQPVAEDPGRWMLLGGDSVGLEPSRRIDLRTQARQLVRENPHARNVLRLLEIYVAGPGLQLSHASLPPIAGDENLVRRADRLWREFLAANRRHFTFREYARRCWRDGECFLRLFTQPDWPPTVRFVDPELIGSTPEHPDSDGILTEPDDVEAPRFYLRIDPGSGTLVEQIPAEQMLHTRIGVDSNQKRGITIFAPLITSLGSFEKWLETELAARRLQASIVLWRKVHGSPSQVSALVDASRTTGNTTTTGSVPTERFQPGSIVTTSQGTELEFLQPNTNLGDAVPLGRLLLLCAAAGAGLPEFMLTSDASNANFASTMVAEGPAVKLFEAEQRFFAGEFENLWNWVMQQAVQSGRLSDDALEQLVPQWTFPQLVSRDRPRERAADVKLVEQRILSRSEVARREGVDPAVMQEEIAHESDS